MSHHKPDPNKNVSLTIDGIPVTVPEGTRILEAARYAHIHIPTLCDHPDLCKRAVCRLCVVECDGRGKLLAACANDVWEGVSIVTHNDRINSVRKMIIELLLANHPQDCLNCVRNTNCELQSLAQQFNIRHSPFRHDAAERQPAAVESNTLVRDMAKCVKCGRCVEACQEAEAIRSINSSHRSIHYEISAPYDQSLATGACVFCGHCAAVCPVGALYEYDQSAAVWAALNNRERPTAVQIAPSLAAAFDDVLGLPAGTVSPGKLVGALQRLGFDQVFNADLFENMAAAETHNEALKRIKNKNRIENPQLPLISGDSEGVFKFVEDSYPALASHLSPAQSPQQMFAAMIKTICPKTYTVSISAGIAAKFKYRQSAAGADTTLTVNELARIFKLAGIDFADLPESSFSILEGIPPKTEVNPADFKAITVNGYAQARSVLDTIRRGGCDAALVKIISCPAKNSRRTLQIEPLIY